MRYYKRKKRKGPVLEYSERKRKSWNQIIKKYKAGQKSCIFGLSKYTFSRPTGATRIKCTRCGRKVTIPKELRVHGWYSLYRMSRDRREKVTKERGEWFVKQQKKCKCNKIGDVKSWPTLEPKDLKNGR